MNSERIKDLINKDLETIIYCDNEILFDCYKESMASEKRKEIEYYKKNSFSPYDAIKFLSDELYLTDIFQRQYLDLKKHEKRFVKSLAIKENELIKPILDKYGQFFEDAEYLKDLMFKQINNNRFLSENYDR